MPAVPVAAIIAVVLIALTPSGAWVSIHMDDEATASLEGSYLIAEVPVMIESGLPYTLEGLEFDTAMVDDVNGSRVGLFSSQALDIGPGESETIILTMREFAPTVLLIAGGLMDSEGSVITFDLKARCGYLLGLADFHLDARISIPLAEGDGKVTYETLENDEDGLVVGIRGLNDSLTPDDMTVTLSGGGCTMTLSSKTIGDRLVLSAESPDGMDSAIAVMRDSVVRVVSEGAEVDLAEDDVDFLLDALEFARGHL